jgi:hypothetical protein
MSEEEDLPRAYERHTPAQLVSEARRYFEEARREPDLRQRAEKGHLAATLAVNALALKRLGSYPRSLSSRIRALIKIDPLLVDPYSAVVLNLHMQCFYEGICDPEAVGHAMKRAEELVARAEKEIVEVEHE